MLKRALLFLLLLPLTYGLGLVVFTLLPEKFHRVTVPGDNSFNRFAEVEEHRPVDLLFVGSSQTYRSFDTRLYAADGLTSFNLGSTSQGPLNSYYVLKRYLAGLDPKVVVLQVCPDVFKSRDGLEAFLDITSNAPYSRDIHLDMALATRNLYAANHLALIAAARLLKPLRSVRPAVSREETYIPGGYVETRHGPPRAYRRDPKRYEIADIQWAYLERIIDLVQSQGRKLVMVVVPITPEEKASVSNYAEIFGRYRDLAARRGFPYHDFNDYMALDEGHFMDEHHLNAAGALAFNRAYLDTLNRILGRPSAEVRAGGIRGGISTGN